jgi:predicted NAD-dependent protein-ADP-ribosyltransferase YbiA (DUF1768 family)
MPPIIRSFSGRYAALSPTFLSGFFFEGDEYQSAAAAFEAAKILNRADRVSFLAWNCKPWEARKKGKLIPPSWVRPDIALVQRDLMLAVQRAKFSWPATQNVLLGTSGSDLVYGNTVHDNYLGICSCREAPAAKRKCGIGRSCYGAGENILGKILMQVRQEFLGASLSVAS